MQTPFLAVAIVAVSPFVVSLSAASPLAVSLLLFAVTQLLFAATQPLFAVSQLLFAASRPAASKNAAASHVLGVAASLSCLAVGSAADRHFCSQLPNVAA